MENLKLKLNEKIDLKDISSKAKKDFERNKNNKLSENQNLIYLLIHRYSNYEEIMWDLYKNNRELVIKQIKSLLFEITKLDRKLSWDCQIILNRYKKDYALKKRKSSWVLSNDLKKTKVI